VRHEIALRQACCSVRDIFDFRARRTTVVALWCARTVRDSVRGVRFALDNVRAAARHDLQAARHRLSNHELFERWQYLPEHLDAIEEHIDALDTWRDWANGKPTDSERLIAAVTSLHHHASHEPADGTQLLVDATLRWAAKQGVELQPPRQPAVEPMRIELDF
jgi:hypothetical protein